MSAPGPGALRGARATAGIAALVVVLAACGTTNPTGSPRGTSSASPSPSAGESEVTESSPEASQEQARTVRIPVVRCPTTYGSEAASPSPLPSTMTAKVDADLAATVSFYGNETLTVLAPKGWDCAAAVGADGSASLVVSPPGSPLPSGSPPPDQQAVTAYSDGACVGCIATDACPVFPEAWSLFAAGGGTCPSRIPVEEKITRRIPQTAVFEDPPGVAGTGMPSGGTYRAVGFMVFDPGTDVGSDRADPPSLIKVTCTLPASLAPICEELVEGVR